MGRLDLSQPPMESLMNRIVVGFGILVVLTAGLAPAVGSAEPAPAAPAGTIDDALRKRLDQKAAGIALWVKLTDEPRATKVKTIVSDWLAVMTIWHKGHDAELNRLWAEWNKAR